MRQLDDGRSALLAYSSVSRLVEGLGRAQPWVELLPTVSVSELQVQMGVDVVVWDARVPEQLWRSGEEG